MDPGLPAQAADAPPAPGGALGAPRRPLGMRPRVLLPLACVPLAFVVYGVAFGLGRLAGLDDDGAAVVAQIVGAGTLAGLAALLWRSLPAHLRRVAVAPRRPAARTIAGGLGFSLALVALAAAIIQAGVALDPAAERRLEDLDYTAGGSAWQHALIAVALILLAPVGEELLFRGLVLRGLAMRIRRGRAILGSALLFAASHPDGWLLWPRAVALVVMGCALGWWYLRRGYLGAVAAHAGVDAIAFSALMAS